MVQSSGAPLSGAPTFLSSSSSHSIGVGGGGGMAFHVGTAPAAAAAGTTTTNSSSSFSNQHPHHHQQHSHNNSSSVSILAGSKYIEDPSFYGSVVDQLHAEQKSTIEALSSQVEFYRQREERYRKEVDSLRKYIARRASSDAANSSSTSANSSDADAKAQAFAEVVAENRALGDEVDAWRSRQSAWDLEKQRLERAQAETESQLRDAKISLANLSHALEQLELKMQRRDAEVQTRVLELEQTLRSKTHECEQLQDDLSAAQETAANLQRVQSESERLRSELLALSSTNAAQQTAADTARREHAQAVTTLKEQLATATRDASSSQREVVRLQLELERATQLLAVRESLVASEDAARTDSERERFELRTLVATLQRERDALTSEQHVQQRALDTTRQELRAAKAQLAANDHSVLVATLRSEIASLKQRLRNEFADEKDALTRAHAALTADVQSLTAQASAKQQRIDELERELQARDVSSHETARTIAQLRESVERIERERDAAHEQYAQLQQCRASLAEHLDEGFKELLLDDTSAAAARRELAALQTRIAALTTQTATLEAQRQATNDELTRVRTDATRSSAELHATIDDLRRQLSAAERELTALAPLEHDLATARDRVSSLETETTALRTELAQLQSDLALRSEQVQAGVAKVQQRDAALARAQDEASDLQSQITALEQRMGEMTAALERSRADYSRLEQKRARERKRMATEMAQLLSRIDAVSTRNVALGDKVSALVAQSKADQTDLVALSAQVKAAKHRVRQLEGELRVARGEQQQQHAEAETAASAEREVATLRTTLAQTQQERDVAIQQRDDAAKRVRLLRQCQTQMQATVEGHTAELVDEIEAIQRQLESERKRCTVLLANEKALLRDLSDRNAAIAKLQQSVHALQQTAAATQQQQQQSTQQEQRHHQKNAYDTNESFTRSSATATTSATTTTNSPRGVTPPSPRRRQQTSLPYAAPAKELDDLLSNLERISNFSAQQQQQTLRY